MKMISLRKFNGRTPLYVKLQKTFIPIFFLFLFAFSPITAQTIVQQHGRLKVQGNKVVNQFNQPISLAGNSLFWSNYDTGAKFYNATTVNHLATNWNTDIVRPAMGVEEYSGYIMDPVEESNKVKAVVDAAINAGVYVIIDWHSHNAEDYQQEAITFFSEMAQLYGGFDNVIYEVYNEPINQSWPEIKSYAEAVINAIRNYDPDNIVVVGTRLWCTEVVEASNNPINQSNIAYTLHFYAGTHTQWLRDNATQAMNNGIALFVTEWGAVNANGDGAAAIAETQLWMQFLQDNDISHANWSIADKAEGASVVAPDAGVNGLTSNNLTNTGWFVKDIIENWNSGGGPVNQSPYVNQNIPGQIEAENYDNGGQGIAFNDADGINEGGAYRNDGVDVENTLDAGGGFNVGWTAAGEWLEYTVASVAAGDYDITFRIASALGGTKSIDVSLDNSFLGSIAVPNTGGWQTWQEVTLSDIALSGGSDQILRLDIVGGAYNINWIDFAELTQQNAFAIHNIPGVVQAENYDFGGQNVAYSDNSTGNTGGSYRNDDVDVENTSDAGGGQNVGWIADGEWLTYTLANVTNGNYDIRFRIASDFTNTKSMDLSLDGNYLGNATIPNTGGWQNWQDVTLSNVSISGGANSVLRMDFNGGSFNINYVEFVPAVTEDTYVIRARGDSGTEQISLTINGNTVQTFNISTAWQNYTTSSQLPGDVRVEFINDAGGRDLEVDYLRINGTTLQAENQVINTSVWQNNSCGGSFSQFMHCGGYIQFSNGSNAPGTAGNEINANQELITKRDQYDVIIYPNPADDYIYINTKAYQLEAGTISLVDQLGILRKRMPLNELTQKIDLTYLPSGIYFVKIETRNKSFVQSILKK